MKSCLVSFWIVLVGFSWRVDATEWNSRLDRTDSDPKLSPRGVQLIAPYDPEKDKELEYGEWKYIDDLEKDDMLARANDFRLFDFNEDNVFPLSFYLAKKIVFRRSPGMMMHDKKEMKNHEQYLMYFRFFIDKESPFANSNKEESLTSHYKLASFLLDIHTWHSLASNNYADLYFETFEKERNLFWKFGAPPGKHFFENVNNEKMIESIEEILEIPSSWPGRVTLDEYFSSPSPVTPFEHRHPEYALRAHLRWELDEHDNGKVRNFFLHHAEKGNSDAFRVPLNNIGFFALLQYLVFRSSDHADKLRIHLSQRLLRDLGPDACSEKIEMIKSHGFDYLKSDSALSILVNNSLSRL